MKTVTTTEYETSQFGDFEVGKTITVEHDDKSEIDRAVMEAKHIK